MGRGRAKAKQTKVARELKYQSFDTDFGSLERELRAKTGADQSDGIPDAYADLADKYAADENDAAEGYGANEYGANEYGANEYGANEYGANEYGVDAYGADEYGADEYGADGSGVDRHQTDQYGGYGREDQYSDLHQSG